MTWSLSHTFQELSRREQILHLAGRLRANLDAIDLNEVDGEFYWRICRDDVLEPLARLAAEFAPRAAEGRTAFDQVMQDLLAADSPRFDEFLERQLPIMQQMPEHVWRHLSHTELFLDPLTSLHSSRSVPPLPIPLRAPTYRPGKMGTALKVLVNSRSWSGADLEAGLASFRQVMPSWFAPENTEKIPVHIDVALVREPSPQTTFLPPPVPFIEVTLPLPLPEAGTVELVYDALVLNKHHLHRELLGSGTKQDKEVALRTWTVGLLLADGMRFMDAVRDFQSSTNLHDAAQSRFGDNRNRLVERVPEATTYLYARGNRTNPLANP